jgi:hypothetical protein
MAYVSWKIAKLETVNADGFTNVVVSADWQCSAEDKGHRADLNGFCRFPSPNPMDFAPYSSLTEEQVLNWIFSCGVNRLHVENMVIEQLNNQIHPTPDTPPLPWDHSALTNT